MRILHVVAGIWKNSGGLAELVLGFAVYQKRAGHAVAVAFVDGDRHPLLDRAAAEGVAVHAFKPSFPGLLFFSREMFGGLEPLVEAADTVHVHSNWTFPVWRACALALRHRKTLAMSPQGCLDPTRLAFSAWKKRLAGLCFDRRYLRRASFIHATCAAEAQAIAAYSPGTPIRVIPNGINADFFSGETDPDFWNTLLPRAKGKKILLYLGRLHPLKGLGELIRAWHILQQRQLDPKLILPSRNVSEVVDEWHLVIAGPDEQGTRDRLREQIRLLGLERSVSLLGPMLGEERHAAMAGAALFVLPTRHDNFAIAVAEALYCRTPAVSTAGAPWAELNGSPHAPPLPRHRQQLRFADASDNETACFIPASILPPGETFSASGRCGIWCGFDPLDLADALFSLMRLDAPTLALLGENGRRLVADRYTWPRLAEKIVDAYKANP